MMLVFPLKIFDLGVKMWMSNLQVFFSPARGLCSYCSACNE